MTDQDLHSQGGHSAGIFTQNPFPTSLCRDVRIVSRYDRNEKRMYNGGCTLWFTTSARYTPLEERSNPLGVSRTANKVQQPRAPSVNVCFSTVVGQLLA